MTFRNAQQSRIYIGILAASCYARNASVNSSTSMLDVTTLCDEERNFIPGLDESTQFSIDGPLDVDGAANGQFDALADVKGSETPTPITFLPLGVNDDHAWLLDGIEGGLDISTPVGGTVDWSMTAQTTGLTDINGQVLENNTTVTEDTNGSAVDGGAASSSGGVAHLHVTAYDSLTSDDITIEGSANGSTGWATVFTFSQVTGLTSERVAVTGSIPRYLRVVDDVDGTGSITRLVAVSRR